MPDDLTTADLEERWHGFLGSMLATSVENCRWLSQACRARNRLERFTLSGSWAKRLLSACVAWRWIFGANGAALPFSEVCQELGLDQGYLRARILAECRNQMDINEVVDRIISEMPVRLEGDRKDRAGRGVVVEWSCLSEVRARRA